MGAPIWVTWVAETGLGAYFGKLIANAHALGLDFLLPIYFLGLVMSFRSRPLWLPVVLVERRRLDHRLQDRRLALACLDRRASPACCWRAIVAAPKASRGSHERDHSGSSSPARC